MMLRGGRQNTCRPTPERYTPPAWVKREDFAPPDTRIKLAQLPTPIQKFDVPGLEDVQMYIKRDDLTGMQLSGNKVRKLEFLLADALNKGADTTVRHAFMNQSRHHLADDH